MKKEKYSQPINGYGKILIYCSICSNVHHYYELHHNIITSSNVDDIVVVIVDSTHINWCYDMFMQHGLCFILSFMHILRCTDLINNAHSRQTTQDEIYRFFFSSVRHWKVGEKKKKNREAERRGSSQYSQFPWQQLGVKRLVGLHRACSV